MQNKILATIFAVLVLQSNAAYAQEPISVLVARSPGVSAGIARGYILELNAMMVLSGMPERQFQNAGVITGNPNLTVLTPCASNNPNKLMTCIMKPLPGVTDLTDLRETYTADIVLVVVPSISALACGSTPQGMFNLDDIAPSNSEWGYAAVALQCSHPAFVASHEVLHLLSIEHDSDPSETTENKSKPVRHNHAIGLYTSGEATAGAQPSDCFPLSACTTVFNYMSDPGEDFPSGDPRGSTLHADAARVVSSQSWDSVASYRSVIAPTCDDPNIVIRQGQCNLNSSRSFLITGDLPGYTVTNVKYRVKLGTSGTWQTIFNGSLSCAVYNTWSTFFYVKTIFTTPQGVARCTKSVVVFDSCWGGDPQ